MLSLPSRPWRAIATASLALSIFLLLAGSGSAQTTCSTDAECDDGNVCTIDACDSALGCQHQTISCDDGNVCTNQICDPFLGCLYADNSASCSDINSCTLADVCQTGVCVGGNRGSGCTACQSVATIPSEGGIFVGATSGSSSLAGSCGRSNVSGERVYQWTPMSSGPARIETCGSSFDTVLYLRGGACTGSELVCNDDATTQPNCAGGSQPSYGSRIDLDVTEGMPYFITVDGYKGAAGAYTLAVDAPTVCGNDLKEGLEECDGTDAGACATGECESGCHCVVPPEGLPDLKPSIQDLSIVYNTTVDSGDVVEGCAGGTTGRDLVRFGTYNENLGTADVFLAAPNCPDCKTHPGASCGNPEFICSPAGGHNHPHYDNYAVYELVNPLTGALVSSGSKRSFCLEDTDCQPGITPNYTCNYQGITAGCGDLYGSYLGCQYVDVTNVPNGTYQLRVTVDPYQRIAEADEMNNVTATTVTINRPNQCTGATVLPAEGGTFSGTTSGSSALTGCVTATNWAPEKVYQWTAPRSGTARAETCGSATTFDTVLYVRSGSCGGGQVACNDDTVGCAASDGSNKLDRHGSRTSFSVSAGQTYFFVVDGYNGSTGRSSGAFQLKLTPP